MKFKLPLIIFLLTILFHSVFSASLRNSTIVEPSDPLGCHKPKSAQLYVFGGFEDSKNPYLTSASQLNSSTGEWEATTNMAVARRSFCGAVVNTKIYLFGGFTGQNPRLRTVEVYDSETGTYSQYRSMLNGVSHCGAAVLNGFVYIAGGHNGEKEITSVIRFNIRTTRREYVRSLHTARFALQLVELGGRLYAIGGVGTKKMEVYNPSTDRWTIVASPRYEHFSFGAAVHEGKIYVCSEKGFEVYSPDTDEWEVLTMPNNNYARTLSSMNGKLWALGGGDPGTKSVHSYNTTTRRWTEQADMDVARAWHSSFVVNH